MVVVVMLASLYGCTHEPGKLPGATADDGNFPEAVNRIMVMRCSTGPTGGGCHNAIGAENAAGLRLDSWDNLFAGGNHGAVVIPYDTVNSSLLHYINTDSAVGAVAYPTMPYTGTLYSATPLSKDEYNTIRNWIATGAPDKNGNVAFGSDANTRQKIYITQQGSDMLSAVDAARHVVMRNIPIGMSNNIEAPHCVRVSKDGRYAYVSFLGGDYVQQIDTRTDKVVGTVKLSNGDAQWNLLYVSDDGGSVMAADFLYGKLVIINTATMQVTRTIPSTIANPHGIAATPRFDTIFVTAQYGNTVFKLYPDNTYKLVSIDGAPSTFGVGVRDPHEIMMSPDGSRYFLSCEWSNEIRVLDTKTDAVVAVINVPKKPQELALSRSKPYLFVTCMEAASPVTGATGGVVVINYETMQIVKTIWGAFWQPHGIAVDDRGGTFYVASTNQTGPSNGHNHSSGGKHGWYNVYSLQTLEPLLDRQYETLVLPYSADSRFK